MLRYIGTIFCFASLFPEMLNAQYDCSNGRYTFNYTNAINIYTDIKYGENASVFGIGSTELFLDFFEPNSDTVSARPLIIFAFPGSFTDGTRGEVHFLCEYFTSLGYVTAAIDYRRGVFLPTEENTTKAVLKAMHDMKAAVRFFKKDASENNTFRVDTSNIMVGGISSGAITALHTAFLDKFTELPEFLEPEIGGADGLSGNLGFSSRVSAVINYSGAIGDTSWIELIDDVAVFSVHDTGDTYVPFKTEEVYFNGFFPTGLIASGSKDVSTRLNDNGQANELMVFNTSDHISYFDDSVATFLVLEQTSQFLYENVVECITAETVHAHNKLIDEKILIYPNPTQRILNIECNEDLIVDRVLLKNIKGQSLSTTARVNDSINQILLPDGLSRGVYFVDVFGYYKASQQSFLSSKKILIK